MTEVFIKIKELQHSHAFGQDQVHAGERRTIIVIAITAATMLVEITAGILFGSMALLADGLHMASHAAALGIAAFAYVYARRHAHDENFSFGPGKVNALGGFTGAVLLAVFALLMGWESLTRFFFPIEIAFNQAIFVAAMGLLVNGVSVFILGGSHDDPSREGEEDRAHHHDHNLRSAYLHVLADALTSILAIFALLAAKYFHILWMDPLMGLVGAALVSRWSLGLLRATASVLLDRQGPETLRAKIRDGVEANGEAKISDLHLWSIGPNLYGVILQIVTDNPKPPTYYKRLLPADMKLAHVSVEVNPA